MKNHLSSMKHQRVALAAIHSDDDTYRITTPSPLDDLIASIKDVGLLNSPLLIQNGAGFTIVCGFRRIEACRSLQWETIPARILDPATPKLFCAKFAVTDNALQRSLNLIEKSRAIELLAPCFESEDELCGELPALGLPENRALIKKIKTLGQLSSDIHTAMLADTIALPMALKLGELDPADATGFLTLFEILKPSLNKQREMLTQIQEIAIRDDIPIANVLNDKQMQGILNHPDDDRKQKTDKIRQYLKTRRFPSLTDAETRFELLVKKLKLGSNIKLIPPKNFEKPTYALTLAFTNMDELKDLQKNFETIIHHPALAKYWTRYR